MVVCYFFALCLFRLFLFIAATVRTDLLHPVTAYYSKRRVKAPIFNQRTTFQHRKGSKMDTMPKKTPGHFPVPLPYTSFAIKTIQNPSVVVVVAASLRTRNGKVGRKSCLSSLLFTLARFFSYTPLVSNVSKLVLHGGAPTKSRSVFFCWDCFCLRSSRLCVLGSFEYYSNDDWVKGCNLGFLGPKWRLSCNVLAFNS